MLQCIECGKEIEDTEAFTQGELVLCLDCTDGYAFCMECGKFTQVDDLNEDGFCEKCAPYWQ